MSEKVTFIAPYKGLTSYNVRILSSVLRANGYPTEIIFTPNILEQSDSASIKRLAEAVAEQSKDSLLLGISFFSCHLNVIKELTGQLRSKTKVPIIWGGKHISARPEDAKGFADIICVGEGEIALTRLTKAMEKGEDYNGIEGIWTIRDGNLNETSVGPLVEDLNSLPYADYSAKGHYMWHQGALQEYDLKMLFEQDTYKGRKYYLTMASRGCPYSCSYCFTFKSFYGAKNYLRFRSPADVIGELKEIFSNYPFFEGVMLSDDNFFALEETKIEEFANLYKRDIGLPLYCLAHPQNVNKKKVELLIDAGMEALQVGIQTGSEKTKKLYKRGHSTKNILEVTRTINAFKERLTPVYDFIIDNPYESREDLLATLHLIHKIPRPYILSIFSLRFFPGTELQRKAQQDGLIFEADKEWGFTGKSYLNFLFLLYSKNIPKWLMRILISKPLITIMDNSFFSLIFYFFKDLLKTMGNHWRKAKT